MKLAADGARHLPRAIDEPDLLTLEALLAGVTRAAAGVRLRGVPRLADLAGAEGIVGGIAAHALPGCRPVRALLFDKTARTNWSLAWHQDRVIAVKQRIEIEGFGPWTTKAGVVHVMPPADLQSRMITLRLHFDPAGEDNGALLIAPGSHRLGRIAEADIPAVVAQCGTASCLAERGDVWLYATPILHASAASTRPSARRVLQIDYSADTLPGGLEWAGL